jgi:uncharacterized membrane protein
MNLDHFLTILHWTDWLALVGFFIAWITYAWYARRSSTLQASLLQTTNRYRYEWLLQCTSRDPRVVDGFITQALSTTPTFFSNTTLLVIGGLLALLGTTDKAVELAREIPFVARTSSLVFDVKIITLIVIFVFAFFRFSWSMRQYTFVALMIGGMPPPEAFVKDEALRKSYSAKAAKLVALAAESFNDGLRAYYFAFAVAAWFISPLAFALATAVVVAILYRREFKSEVLSVLEER